MLAPDLTEISRVEDPIIAAEDAVVRGILQFWTKPTSQRNSEPLFGAIQDLARQPGFHGTLQDVFTLATTELQLGWNPGRCLHQAVIEQWRPHLQGHRHARPIDLG